MKSGCEETDFLIQLFMDGEITKEDRRRLEQHLKKCHRCREEMDKMVKLVHSLKQLKMRMCLKGRRFTGKPGVFNI